MACTIPPLAPRCAAARRKEVLVLCAVLGGPPMATVRLLRAPAWQHRTNAPGPVGLPPPTPDQGAVARTGPPKAIAPKC